MVTDDYQIVHVERVQCSRGGAERVPMALFTKKDLGLLLPDDAPSDPVSLRHTKSKSDDTQQFEPLKPAIDPSKKVVRYRAGQVPHFAAGYEEERGFVTASSQVRGIKNDASTKAAPASSRRRIEAKVVLAKSASSSSSRPRQLAQEDAKGGLLSGSEDGGNPLQDSSSEEDDEEFNRRRRMLRNKMKEREESTGASTPVAQSRVGHAPAPASPSPSPPRKSERRQIPAQIIKKRGDAKPAAAAPAVRHESSSSDSSGSSEWETDTDDSDNGEQLLKPVFVPKKARETLKRQEELAAEEERRVQRELEKQQARKLESRRLVAEAVRREQEGEEKEAATDGEMPDDTDGLDPEQEYRDWELREMRRIKRDRDRKEQRRKEAEETLRRRNMTEEERQAEDAKLKKNEPKEKKQLKFMQKYYHKGAFYMDDSSIRDKEDVRKRDASGATLEDKFNKEMLPQVMQVKNFGRAGRTKYTHLADQDTSTRDSLWNRNDRIREKYIHKMGGMRDLDVKRRKKE